MDGRIVGNSRWWSFTSIDSRLFGPFQRKIPEFFCETIRLKPKIFREFVAFWVELFEFKVWAFLNAGEFFT